ncbi:2-dehydro-3-deoxygalactonokinase [Dyadobacter subterraneus]|uniref:2-dehydro-3-deoxygalactonokinase n=1 Tax=Dyadobacter subterraneus TaxID=2773304 RepID=A0ABR9WAK6_9BACT|nr:2-dehydro-3-deoxygalactonokinase [Dyadobacter subterraneus]MBE9462482.1 2-dehydro-3-deoxygalactonokinase [Dyadobacter subterraneus]
MKKYLLCCDWGTSSFRLRLVKMIDNQLIGEILSPDGIASIFNEWKTKSGSGKITRDQFFKKFLKTQIDILSRRLSFDLDGITIIISGMASSSIGMEEIPYSDLPYAVDGSKADVKSFEAHDDFRHEIILISGVKSDTDVMRGEETQLVGLLNLKQLSPLKNKEATFIFPGTHSKHIYVKRNQIDDFQTFMTGEIFKIMINHSILKDSVESGKDVGFTTDETAAFKKGIRQAGDSNLLNSLFKVRTNQLFDKMSKTENACYLSGLLIGNELEYLKKDTDYNLVLCSGNNLYELYKMAADEIGLSERTTTISSVLINLATIAGQIKIYENQTFKLNSINS